jgi:ketol-acid reductoisomerase
MQVMLLNDSIRLGNLSLKDLKYGGITNMMDRLSNPAKVLKRKRIKKDIMRPLFQKHMDDIISGHFSKTMMEDWDNDDKNLLSLDCYRRY